MSEMSQRSGTNPAGRAGLNLHPTFASQCALAFQLMPDSAKNVLMFIGLLVQEFLSLWSLPLEVLLRWRWGTRGLTLYQVCFLFSATWMSFLFGGKGIASLYLAAAALVGAWHFYEARRHESSDGPWRVSRSWGEPVVWAAVARRLVRWGVLPQRWFTTDAIVFRFLEPGTGLLGIALLYLPPTRLLGYLLLVSGTALFFKRYVLFSQMVNATRDRRDAVEIGRMMSEAADAEDRAGEPEALFEVRLAAPVSPAIRVIPYVPDLPEPPTPATEPLLARVVSGPDGSGRTKVECPGCGRVVRCGANYAERSLRCPGCGTPFVVAAE